MMKACVAVVAERAATSSLSMLVECILSCGRTGKVGQEISQGVLADLVESLLMLVHKTLRG